MSEKIRIAGGKLQVPEHPVIPFIEGDGTGPDIWRASVRVMDGAVQKAYGGKRKIFWMEVFAGEKANRLKNSWLPDETVEACREYLVSIKGPLTTPIGGGIRSLNVALRQMLDLYVCLRPVRWFKGVPSPVRAPEKVDMVIFRENTEDIYAGIEFEEGTAENAKFLALLKENFPRMHGKIRFPGSSGIGIKAVSREGTERLIRATIEYAIANQRKSVTIVHKGNIMKYTEGAFRNWAYALAEKEFAGATYTWDQWERTRAAKGDAAANAEQKEQLSGGRILIKDAIADITLQQVLTRPEDFDCIATMNLNGDYLSDALAAQVGGIGIAPGGNINYVTGHAVFEATHGTAPKYANLDKVNPSSVILSGEMMLRYMGWTEAAELVLTAMDRTIADKTVTYDFARLMDGATEVKCSEFGDALIRNMRLNGALADDCAAAIVAAFSRYNTEFRAITRRAPGRFESRDWAGSQADVVARLELYSAMVNDTAAALRDRLGGRALDRGLWAAIRSAYALRIDALADPEFLKTFFSSITRRLFGTVGVDPEVEFFALDLDPLRGIGSEVVTNRYVNRGSLELLIEELLTDYRFRTSWRDFEGSVGHVATDIELHLAALGETRSLRDVEVIRPVFYQMSRAYVVGRIHGDGWMLPLTIAFRNSPLGVLVDAVMLRESDVSILFSFTRSYFHVDLERVGEAVLFLRSIMPAKPVSELFTVLGRAKQGKTERFREIFRHLGTTADRFVRAPGERGLVMACFTLQTFDVIFKVIRDKFPAVKTVRREEVMAKYDMVFRHDRAGRLVDAQEFRRIRLPRARFEPDMLRELTEECAMNVQIEGDDVIVGHVYIERRMTPLNLYLRSATPEQAELAVIDYGQAIRDLAYTDIFAGDLLLKNFGLTRHSRVIFYDYDELCRVTDCRFRDMPQAETPEDEMRAESWFYVADNDVFPETFLQFLGLEGRLREVFLEKHGEILQAAWWRDLQQRLAGGDVVEVLPYHPHRVRVASSA